MSPSLAEGDFCFAIARNCKQTGGGYENATNSQNPLNSCHIERSEISQENRDSSPCSCKAQNDNIKENSNAEFTHPHTPSASEGAFKGEPSAQQGAFRGESSTQPKESCVNSQSAQQEALTSKPRNERERERRLRQNLPQIHKNSLKATRKARKTHILQSSTTHEI